MTSGRTVTVFSKAWSRDTPLQIDGSDHRWFEDRGAACTLLVLIDDATSGLMQLRFVPSESTDSYFEALQS
jgi:hypothetical protein